jgi:hypothetical protein
VSELIVRLTRLSNERHRFEYRRPDGSGEEVEMETGGLLTLDLAHFAVESEAGLQDGVYGRLARGGWYAALPQMGTGTPHIERVAAVFQGAAATGAVATDPWARLGESFAAREETIPDWMNEALAWRIHEQLQSLLGAWRAMSLGETLELHFPLS